MTREQKLWSMTGAQIIEVAEKLGVKVYHKGNSLKESKEKAIQKILAAEAQTEETVEQPAEEIAETTEVAEVEPTAEVEEPVVDVEPKKEKKAKKTKAPKRTFENLLAEIPCGSNLQFTPNSKRNAVHVKRGNKRIFGYNGSVLVVNRLELLKGIQYETRNYGYVVQPTKENMLAILHNA